MSSARITDNSIYILVGIIILLFSAQAVCADEAEPSTPTPTINSLKPFDRPQEKVSETVIKFGNWLDGFFGNNRIYQDSPGSYLKVSLVRSQEQGEKPAYSGQVRGKLSLPRTQDRLKLLLESDPEEGTVANQPATLGDTLEAQEQTLGLRYIPFEDEQWRVNTDLGVRFRSGLDSFARLRIRRQFPFDVWTIRLSETLFWYKSDGTGETTRMQMDRPANSQLLFRSETFATWLRENDYFDLGQDFLLFHNIDDHQALLYQAGIRGISEPNVHTTEYLLSVRYRKRIHSDWLYFEINPRISYPEERDFEDVKSILLSLDVIFGDK